MPLSRKDKLFSLTFYKKLNKIETIEQMVGNNHVTYLQNSISFSNSAVFGSNAIRIYL